MKEVYSGPTSQGWIYYIDSGRALVPMYAQGRMIWPFQRYWVTWPEDRDGKVIELYRTYFPYDPRTGP